ncbi:serine/threonine-protein kinase [Kitasatospora sp. NPDC051853]|uniref:serine/threonine-protein kinase n=1 Tax=Kitasatospora sp. NPDC051853 TaxID=3364058 RepID=UPI0037A59DAC
MTADLFGNKAPGAFTPLTPEDPAEVGGYRLRARLGAGGMGRVYLAYTPGGRPVALKVVRPELAEDPQFRHRFAQEVASARLIHGLFTAQVVDAGPDAELPWLATAYVPGPSLHQVVHRHGPLPERTSLLLLAGIAEALQAVHAAGVVHRDLKPGNVLLAADGPRVIDFGIARAADALPLTSTGLRIGSPGFMAPEQALGRTATPATDVFALGALTAFIGSGTLPFGFGPEAGSLYRAVHEEPDLDRLPPSLLEPARHCLAKDPADRPTTAQLIDYVRSHPAVGGELRFTDGWLPEAVSSALVGHGELPPTPAPTAAASSLATALLPPAAAAPEAATRLAEPPSTPVPTGRRGGRRIAVRVAVVTGALLIGAVGGFLLLDPYDFDDSEAEAVGPAPSASGPSSPSPSPSSSPSPSATPTPGYAPVRTDLALRSPDSSYEFDLRAGKVTPQDVSPWYLGRHGDDLTLPDGATAYVSPTSELQLPDCIRGLSAAPVSSVPLGTVQDGRGFCLRSRDGADLALVRVTDSGAEDTPLSVTVTTYRRAS